MREQAEGRPDAACLASSHPFIRWRGAADGVTSKDAGRRSRLAVTTTNSVGKLTAISRATATVRGWYVPKLDSSYAVHMPTTLPSEHEAEQLFEYKHRSGIEVVTTCCIPTSNRLQLNGDLRKGEEKLESGRDLSFERCLPLSVRGS